MLSNSFLWYPYTYFLNINFTELLVTLFHTLMVEIPLLIYILKEFV